MDETVKDPVGAEEHKEETEEQTETANITKSKTDVDMCAQPSLPRRLGLPRARSSSAPPEIKNIPEENMAKWVIPLPVPASALPNSTCPLLRAKNVPEQKSNKSPVPTPKSCEEVAVVRPSGCSGPLPGTKNIPKGLSGSLNEQKKLAALADILRDCCTTENENLLVESNPPVNFSRTVVFRGATTSRIIPQQPHISAMIPVPPAPLTPATPSPTPEEEESVRDKSRQRSLSVAAKAVSRGTPRLTMIPMQKSSSGFTLPKTPPTPPNTPFCIEPRDNKYYTGVILAAVATLSEYNCSRERFLVPPLASQTAGTPPHIPAPKPKNGSNIPTYLKRSDVNPQFTPSAPWRFDTVRNQRALNQVEDGPNSHPPPSKSKDSGKESSDDEDEIINVTDVDSPEKKQPTAASTNITSSCTQVTPSPMAIVRGALGARVVPTPSSTTFKGTVAKVVPTLTEGVQHSYSLIYKPAFPGAPGNSVSPRKMHLTPGKPTRVVAMKRPAGNTEVSNTSSAGTSDSFLSSNSSKGPNCRAMPVLFQPRPPLLPPPNGFKSLPSSQQKRPSPPMVYASSRHRILTLRERISPPILSGNDDFVAKRPRFELDDEGYQAPKVYKVEEHCQKFKDVTNEEAERRRSDYIRRFEAFQKPPRTDVVTCSLCGKKICSSSFTILTNHVKWHCPVKRYKCDTCDYHHNFYSRVRMHMLNSHPDSTEPQHKACEELENAWKTMLKKCFPEQYNNLVSEFSIPMRKRVNERRNTGYVCKKVIAPGPPLSFWATFNSDTRIEIDPEFPMETLDTEHMCRSCGEMVEADKTYLPISEHLKEKHADICLIFQCQSCGYSNCEEGIVQWHVSTRHDNVRVIEMPFGRRLDVFVRKFFPTFALALKAPDVDLEEAFFLVQSQAQKVVWYAGNRGHSLAYVKIPRFLRDESVESEPVGTDFVVRYNLKRCAKNTTPPPSPEVEKDPLAEKRKKRIRLSVGENSVSCELCEKMIHWKNTKAMVNLLAHAKRHFRIKQFQCQYCEYDNCEAFHVRNHHRTRHNDAHSAPKSNISAYMQDSWRRLMLQCFPTLADRINAMKFHKTKSYNPSNPPTPNHNYRTRNNTPKPEKSKEKEEEG